MSKKLYDYEVNDQMELYVLIKSADEKKTRNNKPYLALTFQDKSGELKGNYWDSSAKDAHKFQAGTIVNLKGRREEYNGQPQVRISSLNVVPEEEGYQPSHFVETAPIPKDTMVEDINQILFEITVPNINRIVRNILNKYQKNFFDYPAAKTHHHAFNGGLAYHTLTMLKIAKSITEIYPEINKSLLYGGILLHDVGKTIELTGPVATEYSLEGNLVGHIVMISEEITLACQELEIDPNAEDVILLKHMVLSHHGKQEYGSPVVPKIKEAEILHQIDMIDAKINMLDKALNKTQPGEFTNRIFGLDNRKFYHPNKFELPQNMN